MQFPTMFSNFLLQEKGTIAELVWAAKRRFGKQSVMAAHDLAAVTVVQQDDPAEPVHQSSSSAV
jgi:hypothetical protein